MAALSSQNEAPIVSGQEKQFLDIPAFPAHPGFWLGHSHPLPGRKNDS
jgi:hypothetical protein